MKATFQVINQMQSDSIIRQYAIGEAVTATFYLEPSATLDIDIFIALEPENSSPFVSLSPVYEYLKKKNYSFRGEYVLIEGWQVQFLPDDDTSPLVAEATV